MLLDNFSELYMPVTTDLDKVSAALAKPVPPDKMRVGFLDLSIVNQDCSRT